MAYDLAAIGLDFDAVKISPVVDPNAPKNCNQMRFAKLEIISAKGFFFYNDSQQEKNINLTLRRPMCKKIL